jgi:Resolvase, N terminal domain
MNLGYGRVSSNEQDTAAQVFALKSAGWEKIFREKASGARWDRPELLRLLDQLRAGEVLIVERNGADKNKKSVQATCTTINIPVNPSRKRKIARMTRRKVQPSWVDLRMTRQADKRRTTESTNVSIGLAESHCQKSTRSASITGNHPESNRCQRSAKNRCKA